MKDEVKIMYDSPEAAKKVTVTGWISSQGRFWGDDEHMARWNGCTHQKCECGAIIPKNRSKCDKCYEKVRSEIYLKYPFKEWDHKTPLAIYDGDEFFWSEDDITGYLHYNNLKPEDIKLVYCRPEYLSPIDPEIWIESLPEDGEIPKELMTRIDELNKFIKSMPVISWFPDSIRTEYHG